jgi:hypothetical protein
MRIVRTTATLSLMLALVSCGGGSSNPPPPPPPPPAPSALSYPAAPAFTVGIAITALTPTVTGTPTSYSIAPALPAGLALNTTTGAVSGTPTAAQAATNHTVTASNAGGSTTAVLAVTVNNPPPPSITYPRTSYSFIIGMTIPAVVPAATGGAVVSWAVAPALPAGLAFNTANGQISGTPTAASAAATFVVTATNSGGSDTFDLTIAVSSGVVLDLGHASSINTLQYEGSRVLSIDTERHIVLWNAQTGAALLRTDSRCENSCGAIAELEGQTLIVRDTDGFDVYNASDGALVTHINVPQKAGTAWVLAKDGSYVVNYHDTELAIWARNGTALLTRAGDYLGSPIFAAVGEVRIAQGPAGNQVIENIAIPAGTSTSTPVFNGGFRAWFADGERFITSLGTTVLVYSRLGVQEDIGSVPSASIAGGYGNWYWVQGGGGNPPLNIYPVDASTAPAATYALGSSLAQVIPSANTLAVIPYGTGSIGVIDLSGATIVRNDYTSSLAYQNTFAAVSPTEWVVGNTSGVVMGGFTGATPQRYSFGRALSIAGSNTRVSVATAAGYILNFDAATQALENEIAFSSSKLQLSTNGSVLAAFGNNFYSQYMTDRTLKVFSLPARSLIAEFPGSLVGGATPTPYDFDMSADGSSLVRSINQGTLPVSYAHYLVRLDTTPATSDLLVNVLESLVRLSPSGALIAAPTQFQDSNFLQSSTINIYSNGMLTAAASGWAVDFLDDARFLTNIYGHFHDIPRYDHAELINPAGQVVASPTLPELEEIQTLGNDLIYSPVQNVIYNAVTGASVWSTATPAQTVIPTGAVGGDHVFFASGSTIRAEPR